jgi:hypothetical protein
MISFLSGIHFYKSQYPKSTGLIKTSNNRDWIDCSINSIGIQNASLFCIGIPNRKIEDFYEYFTNNNIIWYKLYFNNAGKIFKILKVNSFNLKSSDILNYNKLYPLYEYKLSSYVRDVNYTEDGEYSTYIDFKINYGNNYE